MMAEPSARHAPLVIDAPTFRTLGHQLVDQLAAFLESVPGRPVTRNESPSQVREVLGAARAEQARPSAGPAGVPGV